MPRQGAKEIEIKLRMESAEHARQILRGAAIPELRPRMFESNVLFDTPERQLRQRGALVRIRQAGSESLLTFKGASEVGPHKVREELETSLGDAEAACGILERIGLRPSFRYEKYRTEYGVPGEDGLILLDETPIGVYLELEGAPDWIDRTAARLGFSQRDYITDSYGRLYMRFCEQEGRDAGDMVFTGVRRSSDGPGEKLP